MVNIAGSDNDLMLIWAICLLFPIVLAYLFNVTYGLLQAIKLLPCTRKDTVLRAISEAIAPQNDSGHRWIVRNTWRAMKNK
tara:strand:+ start:101 stop:343 length:243 start_codon:yes stop_codon:yes gene_type:complete